MDTHIYSSLLLLLFFWTSAAVSTISTPFLAPPSSADLAAAILRTRGYSIFASFLSTTTTTNFSGTLFAPPDFSFLNNRRFPPRPSASLLLYHTLKPPLILTWPKLSTYKDGEQFRTLYYDHCLFLIRNSLNKEEFSISSSRLKTPISISAVKIRQPDLYVDDNLTVHGIDSVLDPTFGAKCDIIAPRKTNRKFLDHAIRAIRRKGFSVVATAMSVTRPDLLSLTSVTIFAVSDTNLLQNYNGFRFNFRHHVVPVRHRLSALKATAVKELYTLASNKAVIVNSIDGAVSVDGVPVGFTEIYHNRWIVVVSIMNSLDDVVHSTNPPAIPDVPSPAPFPGSFDNSKNLTEISGSSSSPSPMNFNGGYAPENSGSSSSPSPMNFQGGYAPENSDSSSSPATQEHCDFSDVVSLGVEGGDLLCPVSKARELGEIESLTLTSDVHVDETKSFHPYEVKTRDNENVNIADDLFYYQM